VARYVLKRLGWTLVVLWAIVTLTFAATFLSPIDPARSYAGLRASPEAVEQVREDFGLDDPVYAQYVRYLGRILQGDLGRSFATDEPVLDAIADRLPETLELALGAAIVQLALGIPLGLVAALRHGTGTDSAILALSLLGVVVPTFVLGFLLLYFFAFKLGWFPLGGSGSLRHLVLPAVTLGVAGAAWYARMLRSTALNILSEDYVRTARAKGLPERLVVRRHVLRNSVGPIIAMIGLDIGVFLGGVLVIERVFAWPGIGDQAWRAITFNDVPVVMGTVLVTAFFVTLLNLIADLVNAWLDPRVRYV
jgi:peptide/nickel transport system permease protein